ncbi:type II toxin-antitoxin system VapC family toxin [Stutzerimonas nitrititolerans]|uniref:Type II toxin-antitoxin system VapC family toxin n=1 Tax=Stutzerimonas nitrititolerans TaxID=2482751 RepID=A0AA42BEL2_9GAMM|nr:type II toxin-antitoxin system VapC family toxin [Stutzerimonas nitrititolerans]MCO7543283.1 type II toxin-antitoxin system VapC family toxin [Stutzerimonas nitrititolerans]HAQ27771.1 PIN domain nuclease [Pseudomonas sp.]
MKLLLDTHILLWACAAPSSLPAEAVALIEDRGNDLLFSAASIWEVGIKNAMGKPGFRFDPAVLRRALLDANYQELVMTGQHGIAAAALPPIHNDPFDRMLIGQALTEGFVLVTSDLAIARYAAPIRHVR